MKQRMRELFSRAALVFCASIVLALPALCQVPNHEFGLEHDHYLKEEIKISPFDREEYEKIRKLMILKSQGIAIADMDEIDPNFNPEKYVENNPDGNTDHWNREYDLEEGEYVEDWQEYYERDYDNYERFQREDKREVQRIEEDRSRTDESKMNSPGNGLWGVLLILLLVIILVLVLVFLFLSKDKDTAISKEKIDDLIPSEIPRSELERMLDQAIASKDYRKAIRIYFIFIIKDLSEKGWIVWHKRKTNMSYLREMKKKPFYKEFSKVVSFYEVVWYGKRVVSEEDYYAIEPTLKKTLDAITNHS